MMDPLVIDIGYPRESTCSACGVDFLQPLVGGQGLPWRDGEIVTADDPGEWAGMDACRPCVDAYDAGGPDAVWSRVKENAR